MAKKKQAEKEIKLIAIGERVNGDSLVSAFIKEGMSDSENNILCFRRGKYIVGGKYRAVENEKDDTISIFRKGGYTGEDFDNEACIEKWIKESCAASSRHKKMTSKLRVSKNPLPEHMIEQLKRHTKCLGDNDKIAFLDYLVEEIIWKPRSEEMSRRMNVALREAKKRNTKKV